MRANKEYRLKLTEEAKKIVSEMTLEEMAKVQRLPRSTINYRLKKAKMILKQELEGWYYESP